MGQGVRPGRIAALREERTAVLDRKGWPRSVWAFSNGCKWQGSGWASTLAASTTEGAEVSGFRRVTGSFPCSSLPSPPGVPVAGPRQGGSHGPPAAPAQEIELHNQPLNMLLVPGLIALAAGPLLYQLARGRPVRAALDGFALAAVGGLALLHVIPGSISLAGWTAAGAVLAGLAAPSLVARGLGGLARPGHAAALLPGLAALILQAFAAGTGPVSTDPAQTQGVALFLHLLPLGLTVWLLLRPVYGMGRALGGLAVTAAATAAGLSFGEAARPLQSPGWGIFQAAAAGSLLNLLFRGAQPAHLLGGSSRHVRLGAGLGGFAGIALLAALSGYRGFDGAVSRGLDVFVSLALQSAPALVLAYVAAALVYSLLPPASVNWMRRGSPLSQSARGMGFGLPLPICSCGVVPVYRSLVMQGVPATAGMAFLVATPELSLDALLISLPLLGGEMTVARVVAAGFVALAIGWLLGRFVPSRAAPGAAAAAASPGAGERLAKFRESFRDVVDATAPWILVGLGLAAVVEPSHSAWADLLPAGFGQVELFALLGMPVYVCASGATPLVAILVYKGVSPGAALAFLLTGPATNVTTFGILSQLHGRRTALAFGAGIACLAVLAGHAVNALGPELPGTPLHRGHSASTGLQEISLAALALVAAWSLLRRGPRGFVGQLFTSGGGHIHQGAGEDALQAGPSSEETDSTPAAPGSDCCSRESSAASAEERLEPAPLHD